MIFPAYSFVHILSTRCPQVIHSAIERGASRDQVSISDAANSGRMLSRFNLSNKNLFAVPMMRAGR